MFGLLACLLVSFLCFVFFFLESRRPALLPAQRKPTPASRSSSGRDLAGTDLAHRAERITLPRVAHARGVSARGRMTERLLVRPPEVGTHAVAEAVRFRLG